MLKRLTLIPVLLVVAVVALKAQADVTKTFAVSSVTSPNLAYRFDAGTVDNPPLTLYRGHRYIFDWHTLVSAHPFFINNVGLNNHGAAHLTTAGLSEDTGVGTTTYDIPAGPGAPTTLFYQCGIHDAMSGTLTIQDPPPVPALGTVALVSLAGLVLAVGYLARRRKSGTV